MKINSNIFNYQIFEKQNVFDLIIFYQNKFLMIKFL